MQENSKLRTALRGSKVTYGQLEELYDFVSRNCDVALGSNKTTHAKHNSQHKWREISTILNGHRNGEVKDWKSWCKYWIDYKRRLKKKAALACHQITGGETRESVPLKQLEEKFLTFLSSNCGSRQSGPRVKPFKEAPVKVSEQYQTEQSQSERSQTDESHTEPFQTEHFKTEHSETEQSQTVQSQTEHSETEQSQTEHFQIKQSQTEQSQTEHSKTEQSLNEQSQSQRRYRYRKVSYGQLEALYHCLSRTRRHRDVAMGFNKKVQARYFSQRIWREISTILNAHRDGAARDWKGWAKYWVDYKFKLKKKYLAARASHQTTGDVPWMPGPLKEIDQKFFTLLNFDCSGRPEAKVKPCKKAPVKISEVTLAHSEDDDMSQLSPPPQPSPRDSPSPGDSTSPGASPSSETLMCSERPATPENSSPEDECCRSCLGTEKLMSIFSNTGEERMSQSLKLITGLEIKKNDGLSQKVCTKCLGMFNLLLRFRYKCKEAEKTLISRRLTKAINLCKQDYKNINRINYENVCKIVKLELPKVTIQVEPEERQYVPKADKVKTEDRQSVYMENTDPHIEVEMCKKQETITPVPSPGVCDVELADDQSDDDFEWKEDYNPAINIIQKHEAENVIKQEQQTICRRRSIPVPKGPPYRCRDCGDELDTRILFIKHYNRHNFLVCEACGKRWPTGVTLKMHMRSKHGLEKIHSCAHCNKKFASKELLTIHERVHTGEQPYICEHCGRGFHRRANLIQHLPLHLNQRNFQCSFCPHKGISKKRLQMHVWARHRVQKCRYQCSICLGTLKSLKNIRRHYKKVHRLPNAEHPPIIRVPIC